MKKTVLIVLSIIIYFVVLQLLLVVFVGINFAVFGRGTGVFSALGMVSFWLSYKFVKWLYKTKLSKLITTENINNKPSNIKEKSDSEYVVDKSKTYLTNFNKSNSFLIEYFSKRKKNIALYFLVVHFIKVLIHFFVANSNTLEAKRNRIRAGFRSEDVDFAYLIENIYSQKLFIFVPSFLIVSFFVWYFNGKIKAK
tara:strand:+ start:39 stop:626 length:588 start_codon:yes stop_codon:yes gene_type:complete